MKDQIAFLLKENKRLLGELRKYSNENTPSGSIPPYLKESVREKSQQARKSEKEESKKSNQRNSRPKEHDREREIIAKHCPCCGGKRITRKKKKYTRITLHILFPSIERTLNKIWAYYCLDCKKEVVPRLPDALPGSKFDLNTAILISVLFTAFNLSERKISEMFSTIFSLDISPGSVSNCLRRLKDYLADDYDKLEKEIEKAKYVHRDETGWRKNGKLNWLWVASTAKTVYFQITEKRDSETAQALKLDKDCKEIADANAVYNRTCKEKQKCWAHLSRYAEKPKAYFKTTEEKKDYESLVDKIMALFSNAKKDKRELGCSPKLREQYNKKLLEIIGKPRKRCKRYYGKNAQALKQYIFKQKKYWFTFLQYEYVDPTNNRAERDLRHEVMKRKISQQNRSDDHTESYAMQI
ncbi:IS66 family transposase, partial [Candidatus Woesearchaeota archaeon]|nr:IS66 family transposase [Candidatus Woesearchaeota archaeon]